MLRFFRPFGLGLGLALLLTVWTGEGCRPGEKSGEPGIPPRFEIIAEIGNNPESPFHVDFANYPAERAGLPIGIFDSGTGGLTVLDAILKMDEFDNATHKRGADGLPDFVNESFIYLGDKANMPYGRYDSEGRSDFLRELILKDVQFLLGRNYYLSPEDEEPRRDKPQVKAVVIACNTATAYGLDLIREAMAVWNLPIAVIGIVDAGSRAAVSRITQTDESRLIGVFATEGTCASEGYPRAVVRHFADLHSGSVDVIQQPGFGWAGAVDGDPGYIDPGAVETRGHDVYQGPGIDHPRYPIDPARMREYGFDRVGNALLVREDDAGGPVEIELNSVTNYVRYYVTRMVLEGAARFPGRTLDSVILGCTHYPFFKQEIRDHFLYLRGIDESYARLIPPHLPLIDPAVSEAETLYEYLECERLFADGTYRNSLFFISVPNPLLEQNVLDENGEFPIEYKYGRSINRSLMYVKRVPITEERLAADVVARIRAKMPLICGLMRLNR